MDSELERLRGDWRIVTLEIEGVTMEEPAFKGSRIIVDGNTFSSISMGATYSGNFKVDVTATPKTLDMMFTEGPEKGNTSLGIYELDGDTWRLCLTVSGTSRPKEFVTTAGSGHALETLKLEENNE